MANPTTNFGWVMPTSTDLVTDLPADFAVFGQAVDTSMADLKGGTTGQILAKATNTDMDFTWITNDQGDITAVNTTAPLAGGGTSGALTLSIAAATTSVAGAVQLSDSTSTTSSVLAATPTAVKSAYDLADGAIAKSTVTTAGDIIYRNATVPTRLGLGTAGQVLTVNTGATAPEWKTPSSGGGWTLASTTSLSGSSTSVSIPSGYKQIMIWIENWQIVANATAGKGTFNSDSGGKYYEYTVGANDTNTVFGPYAKTSNTWLDLSQEGTIKPGSNGNFSQLLLNDYENTNSFKSFQSQFMILNNSSVYYVGTANGFYGSTSAITSFQFFAGASTFNGGTIYVYGVK